MWTAPSRRDDIIGLGYVLLFLLVGPLPWHGASSHDESLRIKKGADLEAFASGVSGGDLLAQFVAHAQNLGFEDQPDYAFHTQLLQRLARAPATSTVTTMTSSTSRGRSSAGARGKQKATESVKEQQVDDAQEAEAAKPRSSAKRAEVSHCPTDRSRCF